MRKFRLRTLRRLALLLFCGLLAAIVLRWVSLERWRWSLLRSSARTIEREASPSPSPTPARPPVITGALETARLFNGITVHATVLPIPGGAASEERADPQSYVLDLKLQTRVPSPNKTIEELVKVSPELPRLLPGLATMLKADSVSPFFALLYETKVKSLRAKLVRLDQLLSRHNFYDCQTILDLRHPESRRRAVLLQAEMDVDADGSDSDRLPAGSGLSVNFQPFTSYRWPKRTATPSAYLPATEEKLKRYETELESKIASAERKRELKAALPQVRAEIESLKKFSFLIGATDPYIVIPSGFTRADLGKVGDYGVVIAGDGVYPVLVGDVGPADKAGEASLRIAKEINAVSTPNNRPVSDLKVTYLVFPGTADAPFAPPDLEKMRARCEALVQEIGGAGVPLHRWENVIPPPPPPTPTQTPSSTAPAPGSPAAASPAPTFAFPLPSATPGASAEATSTPLIPTTSPLVRPSP